MFVSSHWRHTQLYGTVKFTGELDNLLSCVLIFGVPSNAGDVSIFNPLPMFMEHLCMAEHCLNAH